MKTINDLIVKQALKYVGEKELKGNSGFENEVFWMKMEAVGFDPGEAWCALFAELIWREGYGQYNSLYDSQLEKLFSQSAVATFNNFKKSTWLTSLEPAPGDVVIWQMHKAGRPHWSGHAGIVTKVLNKEFDTVEGNTNAAGGREGIEVTIKRRVLNFDTKLNGLVLKGFIKPKI